MTNFKGHFAAKRRRQKCLRQIILLHDGLALKDLRKNKCLKTYISGLMIIDRLSTYRLTDDGHYFMAVVRVTVIGLVFA